MKSRPAFIYVRISEDREGAGLGVQRQEADCRDLADSLGWSIVDVLCDNDVSAYSGKPRPAYRDLLARLEAGEATGVLVWHTDRLHRSPAELEDYVTVCEKHGVVTHTVKAGPLDLSSPSGRLVARQLGAVARYEVEHSVERLRSARLQSVKAGKWAGGRRPFGYEADGVTVRDDEAAEVLAATKAVVDGRSLGAIASDWNERGVLTSSGGTWRSTEVRRLLLRARNAGLMVHHGEVAGQAEWEAIVPEDLWLACRAVLTDESRRSNYTKGRTWLGGGLFVCGLCGAPMRASTDGKRRRHYSCSVSKHVVRHARQVDGFVTAVVLERLRASDAADALIPPAPDTSGLHVEAQGYRERLTELGRLYADGAIEATQLAEGTERLRGKLEEVNGRIAAASTSNVLAPFADADPAEVWQTLDLERRRAVIDALMTVRIHKGRKGRPPGWKPGEPYFDPSTIEIEWEAG